MREIKFRMWRNRERMLSEDELSCMAYLEPTGVNETIKQMQEEGNVFMQYTGLKDKNGKEIYEGDILQFVDRGGDTYGRTFLMKWVEEQGAWTFYFPKKDAIVIGNIYENPELLDEE